MKKTITNLEVKLIGTKLFQNWNEYSKEIKLNTKSLYSLIKLRKTFEQQLSLVEDTMRAILEQNECTLNDQGGYNIPAEKRELVNNKLNELGNENFEFEYNVLAIGTDDKLPVELMELLFDYIEIKE